MSYRSSLARSFARGSRVRSVTPAHFAARSLSTASSSFQTGHSWRRHAPRLAGTVSFVLFCALSTSLLVHADDQASTAKGSHPDESAAIPHPGANEGLRVIDAEELTEHTTRDKGVWVVIEGTVWDVTDFLDMHPAPSTILRFEKILEGVSRRQAGSHRKVVHAE